MSVRTRRPSRALAVAATVTACFAAAAIPASPALGDEPRTTTAQPRTIHVTGLLKVKDAALGTYDVTGSLTGVWTIPPPPAEDYYYNSETTIIQKGQETFSGCLTGTRRCGTLNSDYISWTYQQKGGQLITGGCVHAPTGGTKVFKGVRGLIVMDDTSVDKEVTTVYKGDIILNAKPDEGPVPLPKPPASAVSAAAASASAGSC